MRKSPKKKIVVSRDLFPLTPEKRLLLEIFGEDLELFLILIDGQLFGPYAKKEKAGILVQDLSKNPALREKVSLICLKTNKLGTPEEAEALWISTLADTK